MDNDSNIKKAYESILRSDFEQAALWFEQAVAEQPDNAAYHYKLSITYARSNKLAKAVEHAHKACEISAFDPLYASHLRNLQAKELIQFAEKQMGEGRHEVAVFKLREATTLDPLATEAHLILGLAYAHLGQYDEATAAMDEVLRLDPHNEYANRWIRDYRANIKQ